MIMQLQYAQMTLLNFPALTIPNKPNFSWPHVNVGTLQRTFGLDIRYKLLQAKVRSLLGQPKES